MMLNVMPGLVPCIHVFLSLKQDVDGRDKPGHDKNKTRGVGFRQAFPFRTHIAGIFCGHFESRFSFGQRFILL
jgi:hypothetical protein